MMEPTTIITTVFGMLAIILVPGVLLAKAFIKDIEDTAQLLVYALVLGFSPQLILYFANAFFDIKITETASWIVLGTLCLIGGIGTILRWNQDKHK